MFIGGFCFLILASLTQLAFPGLLSLLIDASQNKYPSYIPKALQNLTSVGLLAIALQLVGAVVSFFRINFFVQVSEKSLADIRRDTFFKLITLEMNFFANRRVGELNSRISADLSQIQDAITSTFAEVIKQTIVVIGSITILVYISLKLTLVMLLVAPILIVAGKFFGQFIRQLSRDTQDKLAESNTVVEENLQGIASVKAFVNEAYEANRYVNILKDVVKLAIKGARYRGLFSSFITFCMFGTILGMIWYGSYLVSIHDNGLTFGTLTGFILYSAFAHQPWAACPTYMLPCKKP